MSLSHEVALKGRADLAQYGDNARLLFALQARFRIADIHTIAADSLTDGPDDKKCDLLYVDNAAGNVVLAQGYEASVVKEHARVNKASDLNTALSWLVNREVEDLPKGLQPAAEALRSSLKDNEIRSFQIWYVHNLDENGVVRDEMAGVESTARSMLKQKFPSAEVEDVSAIEVGRKVLEEWYQALEAPIIFSERLSVEVPGFYEMKGDTWEAAVTSVPAKWLHGLWKDHGSKLFSANVREYLGSRRSARNVNHNIKDTANNMPERFWAYNNGLTALVHDYSLDEPSNFLTLHGLSIVNGAQTTGALGSLHDEPGDEAYVQARFVKCSDIETVQKIIQYNNTQNVVRATDFRSNDPVQQRLRREFDGVNNATYLGGRRGGEQDAISRPGNLMPTDTCGQAVAAVHLDPVVAYNQKAAIWENDELYTRFFREETTAKHIVFCYSLLRAVEKKKNELMSLGEERRSKQQEEQVDVLRKRGATFVLVAAISYSLETMLDRAISNRFRVSFGNVDPDVAIGKWAGVVNATIPFCNVLDGSLKGGLKNKESAMEAAKQFSRMIDATKSANSELYEEFSGCIHFS